MASARQWHRGEGPGEGLDFKESLFWHGRPSPPGAGGGSLFAHRSGHRDSQRNQTKFLEFLAAERARMGNPSSLAQRNIWVHGRRGC